MGSRFTRTGMILALVALALPAGLANANASANTTLALWNLNEAPGATVMVDSSGNGINGAIGSAVQTGLVFGRRHVLSLVERQADRSAAKAGAGHPDQQQSAEPRDP